MPNLTVELTREQLLSAIRQLPESDRIEVIAELFSETDGFPQGDEARKLFKRLRNEYRTDAKDDRRMSDLLAKANERKLSTRDRRELDALLEEYQQRSLQLALAVMFSGPSRRKTSVKRRDASG